MPREDGPLYPKPGEIVGLTAGGHRLVVVRTEFALGWVGSVAAGATRIRAGVMHDTRSDLENYRT